MSQHLINIKKREKEYNSNISTSTSSTINNTSNTITTINTTTSTINTTTINTTAINPIFVQQLPSNELKKFKIIIIGCAGSGKTSIIKRAILQIFDENVTIITIGMDFHSKIIFDDNRTVKLQLWVSCLQLTSLSFSLQHQKCQ